MFATGIQRTPYEKRTEWSQNHRLDIALLYPLRYATRHYRLLDEYESISYAALHSKSVY